MIAWEEPVFDAALRAQVVTSRGPYYDFGDELLGHGRAKALASLREHPEILIQLLAALQAHAGPEADIGPSRLWLTVEDCWRTLGLRGELIQADGRWIPVDPEHRPAKKITVTIAVDA